MKRLAFVDVETTGLEPWHEMIEVGVVIANAATPDLDVLHEWDARIKPQRIEVADSEALRINGYVTGLWEDAIELSEALETLRPMLDGAMLAGQNPRFDWGVINYSCIACGVPAPKIDRHMLDVAAFTWGCMINEDAGSPPTLDEGLMVLGLKRNEPHRALADARAALAVARFGRCSMRLGLQHGLNGSEYLGMAKMRAR